MQKHYTKIDSRSKDYRRVERGALAPTYLLVSQRLESAVVGEIGAAPWSRARREGVVEDGFEEASGFGLGGGELGFEAVAEGHQLVDLGDDAVLFGDATTIGQLPAGSADTDAA